MNRSVEAHGVRVWSDGGWLYRERDGVRRCIGTAEDDFVVLDGGAVLVGDEEAWVAGAASHGSCRALPVELPRDSGLTVVQGRFVLARDADEMEVLLDLQRGRAIDVLGPVVSCPGPWATVHWDTGEGRWFDPVTTEVKGTFAVDVPQDDVIVSGECCEDGVIWHTAEGAVLAC